MRVTMHILDGASGDHAGDVPVGIYGVETDGARVLHAECVTDPGGRARAEIPAATRIDVVIGSGARFAHTDDTQPAVEAVTLRIAVPEGIGGIHLPTVIAPHSSSLCWLKVDT